MNVSLAVQVSSTNVRKVLSNCGPADATGTAKFCLFIYFFFFGFAMNVSSVTASSRVLKSFYITIYYHLYNYFR